MKTTVRMNSVRTGLSIVVTALAVVALAASGETNAATKVSDSPSKAPTTAEDDGASSAETTVAESSDFKVGDVIALGDWELTVNSVVDPFTSTNEFDTPTGRYVAVDVTVRNNGASPENVSSLICFEVRDQDGRQYSQTIVLGGATSPDGEVDAGGGVISGTLYYDVPEGVTGLELRFKCDLFSEGSATVKL